MNRLSTLTVLLLLFVAGAARADSGTVRMTQTLGDVEVTILTAPTPCRVGVVEFTVFARDKRGRDDSASVSIRFWPTLHSEQPMSAVPVEHGPVRCLRGEFAEAGSWQVEVTRLGHSATFQLDVAAPPPRWQAVWLWMAWPIIPLVLFAVETMVFRRGASQ